MSLQSATASATVLNSVACASSRSAPTAERASRKANSYGFTTRRWQKPKLLMARAAAPMLRGFRGATRTTRRRSESALGNTEMSLQQERSAGRKALPSPSFAGQVFEKSLDREHVL